MAQDCVFCGIVNGDVPSHKIEEDEHTLAFMDLNPWTRGHALVIPKKHVKNLYEVADEDIRRVVGMAKRVAVRARDRLDADGVNLLNSTGEAAWQSVFHFHMHVIPRYDGDPLDLPAKPEEAEQDELEEVAGILSDEDSGKDEDGDDE